MDINILGGFILLDYYAVTFVPLNEASRHSFSETAKLLALLKTSLLSAESRIPHNANFYIDYKMV